MPEIDTLKRLGRILNLIGKLDSGPIQIKRVAEEFGVVERTIQRDVTLLHRSGFYIQELADGYRAFPAGVRLANRKLTAEQQTALAVMAPYAKNLGAGLSESFENLFRHLTSYAPWEPFIVPIMPRLMTDTIPYIKDIEEAINDAKELEIEYQSDENAKPAKHYICPLKVLVAEGFAYIFSAYKNRKGQFPKFRIDRIKSLKVLDEITFVPPEGMEEALAKARNVWGAQPDSARKIKVKLKVESWARDYYRRQELVGGQTIKEQKDGSLIFEAKICQFPEIMPHIMRWIPHVTVIEPKELKEEVLRQVDTYRAKQN